MSHIDAWIDRCRDKDRGRIFLDNLGIDLEFGFLSDLDLKRFCMGLETLALDPRVTTHTEPYARAAALSIEENSLLLRGQKRNRSARAMAYIFRLDRFIAGEWFDLTSIGGYGDLDGPEEILKRLQANGGFSGILRPGAKLRGRLPVVWLAFDDEITRILSAAAKKPESIRNELGLLHYQEDHYLCRMIVPTSGVRAAKKRRPTAFDGGPNLVFRGNHIDEPCGRAIHLRTQTADIRELVANPIPIRDDFVVEDIGRLSRSATFSWADLARKTDSRRINRTIARVQTALP